MDPTTVLQFDVRGTAVANRVLGEKLPIDDKTCPWLIPDASPFFGEAALTKVYDARGALLTINKDYWLEEEFQPFCEVTGRSIKCFIRLSDPILAANAFITVDYQSLGAFFFPRSLMKEWLKQIQTGVIPIDWSKVLAVPPTLPPSLHSHSVITEIGDWYELSFFFRALAGIYRTRDIGIYEEADTVIDAAMAEMRQYKLDYLTKINAHDGNYSAPHQPNKSDVQLGNLMNYSTASLADDLAGTRADLYSTPMGVQQLVKRARPNDDQLMKTGIAPFSKFSNGGYIPPTITGSFEGLGSRSECMGICVEPSGRTVTLQNHFDGRSEGLYFSILDNYDKPFDARAPYRYDYTAYKYEPPVLKNQGVEANHIVMGSGNDIIMVGQVAEANNAANDKWFVSLANDSFDPSGHRFIKVNMAPIFAQCGNPADGGTWGGQFYFGRMSIYLLDQYAYLIVDSTPSSGHGFGGRMSHWRIPRQNLIDGVDSTWQLVKVTFQDYDGVQYTSNNWWEWAQKVVSGGTFSRWGRYNFSALNPPTSLGQFARRSLVLMAKKPGTSNIFYWNFLAYTFLDWAPPGKGLISAAPITNIVYEFNIETGAMTLLYKQPVLNIDYLNNNLNEINTDRAKWIGWYDALVRYTVAATIILPSGERLTSMTAPGQEASILNSVIQYGQYAYSANNQTVASRADLVKGNLGTDRIKLMKNWTRLRNMATPIPIGISSRWLAYENGGENFMTYPTGIKDLATGIPAPAIVCRNVAGPYAIRPEVTNPSFDPVYSRPLVNTAYETNMSYLDGVISMSGSAAELAARGVECGNMSLSGCGYSAKHINTGFIREWPSATMRAKDTTGTVLTFPKTYTRTLDAGAAKMMYTPTSWYGINATLREKIRQLIPAGVRGDYWCFGLWMLNGESGGMFTGLNKMLLVLRYPELADGSSNFWNGRVFLLNPVVEAPNANHPGCTLITDFTIAGQTQEIRMVTTQNVANHGAMMYQYNRPMVSLYREGNKLKGFTTTGFSSQSSSTYSDFQSIELDLTTGVFEGVGNTYNGWSTGDPCVVIPKVGLSRYSISGEGGATPVLTGVLYPVSNGTSGGAARIYPYDKPDGSVDYYATITGYPETGWVVFFIEEVEMMINGAMYRMPTGTVDLRDIDADPRNKTFYIYATVEDTQPKYVLSVAKLRKRSGFLLAAVVTTNEKQILTIERLQPFMIGEYTLAFSRDGGIIPVSAGFPQDDGNFRFLRNAELLP